MNRKGLMSIAFIPILLSMLFACSPSLQGSSLLSPTLSINSVDGGAVAFQNNLPVPSFDFQPRSRVELDGVWKFQPAIFDSVVSFLPRPGILSRLNSEAGTRLQNNFDDSGWQNVSIPGALNMSPGPESESGWLRHQFTVPANWTGQFISLKFGAINYLADVWLNGKYQGYHEGGSTPFAFDASKAILPGQDNFLLVRVYDPPLGSREDIVPWGLTDWWNYVGIIQPVYLEAASQLYIVRADITPHLDAIDVRIVLHNHGSASVLPSLDVGLLPTQITNTNLLDPNTQDLIPSHALAFASTTRDLSFLDPSAVRVVSISFAIGGADAWSPQHPALYAFHVSLRDGGKVLDQMYESFGLRTITVDPTAPRILLNGETTFFSGVNLLDEKSQGTADLPQGGPIVDPRDVLYQLNQALAVHATLLRTGHMPANPLLLQLADRLGFAIWEEIPLYHYSPESFNLAMGRGIPQQMLAEMDLRDMNHPSVLFHGFANESTGTSERENAMLTLRDLDRQLDGTRLTGQAAYGFDVSNRSSSPLDVAGYTMYYGVFYGSPNTSQDTRQALLQAHATYPNKPILILEFGRWGDSTQALSVQTQVFQQTMNSLNGIRDTDPKGFVASALWWSLDDYLTQAPGISVERFGLFRPDNTPRPIAQVVTSQFAGGAGLGDLQAITPSGRAEAIPTYSSDRLFVEYLVYALLITLLLLSGILLALSPIGRSKTRT